MKKLAGEIRQSSSMPRSNYLSCRFNVSVKSVKYTWIFAIISIAAVYFAFASLGWNRSKTFIWMNRYDYNSTEDLKSTVALTNESHQSSLAKIIYAEDLKSLTNENHQSSLAKVIHDGADDKETWPVMKIVQSVGVSLTDALTMSLTCTATCNCTVEKDNTTISNISQYDMKWSGMDLEHSLWIEQSHVIKEGDIIERKLFFKPWLGSHAGDYFCHFMKKDQSHVKTQKTVVSGEYRGLINSRNFSQKYASTTPGTWFTNANLCGGNNVWQEYADFHKSALLEKGKGRYLVFECTYGYCGGYGNRLSGITVLLVYAMLTKRVFLLDMTIPVDINSYYLPNAIQWNHVLPTGLKTKKMDLKNEKNFLSLCNTFEATILDDEYDVVRIQINFGLFYFLAKMNDSLLNSMISMFNLKTHYDVLLLYGCAFNYLFKYQPKTSNAIETLQSELGLITGKFVGLHIRSRIGDPYQPFDLSFEPLFECAAIAAKALSQKLNLPKVPIFLAADHPNVIQYAKQHYNDSIVISKAPRFHVDETKYGGTSATTQYDSGMIGVLSDMEICSRGGILVRSLCSTMSEVMSVIHFLSPQKHLHPFYFYDNLSVCKV